MAEFDLAKLDGELGEQLQELAPNYRKNTGIKKAISETFNAITITSGVDAGAEISVMNKDTKSDDDGIVAMAGKEQPLIPGMTISWVPQIKLSDNQTVLKTALHAGIDASASAGSDQLKAKLHASSDWRIVNYWPHARNTKLQTALLKDANRFVWPHDYKSVKELDSNAATVVRTVGELGAEVTFSVSDAITSNVGSISNLFGPSIPLAFAVSQSLKISASIRVIDSVKLSISRLEADKFRVAILRDELDERKVGVNWAVSVTLDKEAQDVIKKSVEQIAQSIFDQPLQSIEQKVSAIKLDNMSPQQEKFVDFLIERFGLQSAADPAKEALAEIKELRTKLTKSVESAVKTKAEMGFSYEYVRQEVDTALFQFTVSLDKFTSTLHKSLISFDIDKLPKLLVGSETKIERDVQGSGIKEKISSGFSFTLGKTVGNKLTKERNLFVLRKRMPSGNYRYRVAIDGSMELENLPGGQEWAVEVRADSEEYLETPRIGELKLGLNYFLVSKADQFDDKGLRNAVDRAMVYGVIPEGESLHWVDRLGDAIGRKRVQIRYQVKLSNKAMRKFVGFCGDLTENNLKNAQILAAALPWTRHDGRADIIDRISIYQQVFEYFGSRGGRINPQDVGRKAEEVLWDYGYRYTANNLEDPSHHNSKRVAAWLAHDLTAPWRRLRSFTDAMTAFGQSDMAATELDSIRKQILVSASSRGGRAWPEILFSVVGRFLNVIPIAPEHLSRTMTIVKPGEPSGEAVLLTIGERA